MSSFLKLSAPSSPAGASFPLSSLARVTDAIGYPFLILFTIAGETLKLSRDDVASVRLVEDLVAGEHWIHHGDYWFPASQVIKVTDREQGGVVHVVTKSLGVLSVHREKDQATYESLLRLVAGDPPVEQAPTFTPPPPPVEEPAPPVDQPAETSAEVAPPAEETPAPEVAEEPAAEPVAEVAAEAKPKRGRKPKAEEPAAEQPAEAPVAATSTETSEPAASPDPGAPGDELVS